MDTSRTRNKKMGFARLIAGNIAIFGLLLITVEGLASYGLLVRDVMTTNSLAERRRRSQEGGLAIPT